MKIRNIMLYALGISASTGCVDTISFENTSRTGQLVFYGEFTQLDETHFFSIHQTAEYGDPPKPVTGAEIMIFDDQGNTATYVEQESGTYQLAATSFPGVPGRIYHVEITLANGNRFSSSPQALPVPIEIEDLYFKVEPRQVLGSSGIQIEQAYLNLYLETPLQNDLMQAGGLRWQVEEAYSFTDLACHSFYDPSTTCYFRIPAEDPEVKLFSIGHQGQESLHDFPVYSRILAPDDEFVERHYFSVYQHTIPEDAYHYWERVKLVANQSGDLLDRPPAGIVGNIFEKNNLNKPALGYFEVSAKSIKRLYTLPHLIDQVEVLGSCPEMRDGIEVDKCCFCYLADDPENRIERPEYWDD